jgi:hypothetical protein
MVTFEVSITPTIPHGRRFWPLTSGEKREIDGIFCIREVRNIITALQGRDADDRVEVLDAAYWMKGVAHCDA